MLRFFPANSYVSQSKATIAKLSSTENMKTKVKWSHVKEKDVLWKYFWIKNNEWAVLSYSTQPSRESLKCFKLVKMHTFLPWISIKYLLITFFWMESSDSPSMIMRYLNRIIFSNIENHFEILLLVFKLWLLSMFLTIEITYFHFKIQL